MSINKKLTFKNKVITKGVVGTSCMTYYFAKKISKNEYSLITKRLGCLMHIIDCWLHIQYGKQYGFSTRCDFKWPPYYKLIQKDKLHLVINTNNYAPNIVTKLRTIIGEIEQRVNISPVSTVNLITQQDSSTWVSLDLHKDWFLYPVTLHGLLLIMRYLIYDVKDQQIDNLVSRLSVAFIHRQSYLKSVLSGFRNRRKNLNKLVDICHGFMGFENLHVNNKPVKIPPRKIEEMVKNSMVYCSKT